MVAVIAVVTPRGDIVRNTRRHRRLRAWRDRVDRDAVADQLLRHRAREAEHAGLGYGVVALADVAAQARARREVDDAAGALLVAHPARRGTRAGESAGEAHRDHRVPIG